MTSPPRSDGITKAEHDTHVAQTGRPYTQPPMRRRQPRETTDLPPAGHSIIDLYTTKETKTS